MPLRENIRKGALKKRQILEILKDSKKKELYYPDRDLITIGEGTPCEEEIEGEHGDLYLDDETGILYGYGVLSRVDEELDEPHYIGVHRTYFGFDTLETVTNPPEEGEVYRYTTGAGTHMRFLIMEVESSDADENGDYYVSIVGRLTIEDVYWRPVKTGGDIQNITDECFRFYGYDITTPPEPEDVYTINGSEFTVLEVESSTSRCSFLTERTSGANDPDSSGTLTKVSGAGQGSIDYTSYANRDKVGDDLITYDTCHYTYYYQGTDIGTTNGCFIQLPFKDDYFQFELWAVGSGGHHRQFNSLQIRLDSTSEGHTDGFCKNVSNKLKDIVIECKTEDAILWTPLYRFSELKPDFDGGVCTFNVDLSNADLVCEDNVKYFRIRNLRSHDRLMEFEVDNMNLYLFNCQNVEAGDIPTVGDLYTIDGYPTSTFEVVDEDLDEDESLYNGYIYCKRTSGTLNPDSAFGTGFLNVGGTPTNFFNSIKKIEPNGTYSHNSTEYEIITVSDDDYNGNGVIKTKRITISAPSGSGTLTKIDGAGLDEIDFTSCVYDNWDDYLWLRNLTQSTKSDETDCCWTAISDGFLWFNRYDIGYYPPTPGIHETIIEIPKDAIGESATNGLPLIGYYQIDVFISAQDLDEEGNVVPTTVSSELQVRGNADPDYETVDISGYGGLGIGSGTWAHGSLQGSAIVEVSGQECSQRFLTIKYKQGTGDMHRINGGYCHVEYLGTTQGKSCE